MRRSRHLKSESGRFPTSAVDEAEIHYDEPNISQVTPKEILSFAWQICKGMAYLSEIKVILFICLFLIILIFFSWFIEISQQGTSFLLLIKFVKYQISV